MLDIAKVMSSQDSLHKLSDLPDTLIARMSRVLHSFSTGIVKAPHHSDRHYREHLIGSGTLVLIDGIPGILTAQHVAQLLDEPCQLGLILTEREHRFTIDCQYLKIIEIPASDIPGQGPDLAFIGLPKEKVSDIKVYKSFYNLSTDREMSLTRPPALDRGVWFVCGIPDERTIMEQPGESFDIALSFFGFCGAGGANRQFVLKGYDYIEVDVEYISSVNIPTNFGGVSGGGLWQVTVKESREGQLEPVQYFFCGIPFYQSELRDNKRFLRCHGRESIYRIAFDHVKSVYT